MYEPKDFFDAFLGYNILDCVVQDKTTFYFVAHEDQEFRVEKGEIKEVPDDDYLPKRVIYVSIADPEKPKIQFIPITNFAFCIHCEISFEPKPTPIVLDARSEGWINNPDTKGLESAIPTIPNGGCRGGAVTRIRSFGEYAICCTNNRELLQRKGFESWERIGPEVLSEDGETGFSDFDAFGMDDIYAGGGRGDLWRYDGKHWDQIDFPSNLIIESICCAPNGSVYIGCEFGNIYKGKDDHWELIHEDEMTLPFNDMVWHDQMIWCTSDFGIWTLKEDKLSPAEMRGASKVCCGNLSARDETLLMGGFHGAAFRHDGEWKTLFNQIQLRELWDDK